jgi:predicted transcriptional regulator of viral defense system
MTPAQKITAIAQKLGVFRPREVHAPRRLLAELVAAGVLERSGRGLYRMPSFEVSEHHSLVEVVARIPHAKISLLSALQFHGIGTQVPSFVWITLDVHARKPRHGYPPLRVMRASGAALTSGIEYHQIEGRKVAIYSIEKTVADCFKYRNKIGLDVALEALKDSYQAKRLDMDQLWRYARLCRVARVIRPYIEAIQ